MGEKARNAPIAPGARNAMAGGSEDREGAAGRARHCRRALRPAVRGRSARRLPIAALGAVLLAVAASCGGGGGDVDTWRLALEEIEGSVQHAYGERFRQLVEQRSGGTVSVSVYPYGALGTSAELTEQVQGGALQLAFASPGHLGSVVPEVQVLSLHFVFSDDPSINQRVLATDGALAGELRPVYRERSLVLLDLVQEGWMAWTGDRALRRPEDFEGFKIRTMASPLLVEAYEAYGGNPTPMPYSEVYGALQLNMIDGQVNPVFAIEEMSFYEVQEVMTLPRHLPFVSSLVASPAFVDGLSPERRQLLEEVVAELDEAVFGIQRDLNAERMEVIRQAGDTEIVELDEEQRKRFREASLPVRDRYLEIGGERAKSVLETLLAEVRRLEREAAEGP